MKNITLTLLVIMFCSGCAVTQRMINLKEQNRNTVTFQITSNILQAKELTRLVAKEMNLLEAKNAEKEDFILLTVRWGKTMFASALTPAFGALLTCPYRLGIFYSYDNVNQTTITICEENNCSPQRYNFADKVKLRVLELTKSN